MKRKATFTTDEVRAIITLQPADQKEILDATEKMAQMSLAELKTFSLSENAQQMLHARRAQMIKRAEAAEKRRTRKEQKQAKPAAEQSIEKATEPTAATHASYDRETLRCAVTAANLFNGGVAFRDHSFRWVNEADSKFEYEMDGTMKCIEKIIRRLLRVHAPNGTLCANYFTTAFMQLPRLVSSGRLPRLFTGRFNQLGIQAYKRSLQQIQQNQRRQQSD